MPRELTIISDSAYERSHRLAKKLGKSVTEVVDDALAEFEAVRADSPEQYLGQDNEHDDLFTPEAIAARGRQWEAIRERVRSWGPPQPFSDQDLYNKDGLPK